jgi:hypothetical protein
MSERWLLVWCRRRRLHRELAHAACALLCARRRYLTREYGTSGGRYSLPSADGERGAAKWRAHSARQCTAHHTTSARCGERAALSAPIDANRSICRLRRRDGRKESGCASLVQCLCAGSRRRT